MTYLPRLLPSLLQLQTAIGIIEYVMVSLYVSSYYQYYCQQTSPSTLHFWVFVINEWFVDKSILDTEIVKQYAIDC